MDIFPALVEDFVDGIIIEQYVLFFSIWSMETGNVCQTNILDVSVF